MWPWGHAAVGYLAYSAVLRWRSGRPPTGPAALAVALAALGPDLVDKTASWYLGVLPAGRSLAHSLFAVVAVAVLARWVAGRLDARPLGLAVAIGYASHPLADGLQAVLTGDWAALSYLLWPLLAPPPYTTEPGIWPHLLALEVSPFFILELALTALSLLVWHRDGRPGLAHLWQVPRHLHRRVRD